MSIKSICKGWEWVVLALTLLTLTLFLTGHKLFGLSGVLESTFALFGSLVAAIISFLVATMVLPLIALITGVITAFIAVVTTLASLLIGGIFTPLAVLLTGWVTTIFTWLAGTWLGSLLMPIYTTVAPLVLKIAPWITVSKSATKALDTAERIPFLKKWLARIGLATVVAKLSFWRARKRRPALAAPSQSARPGRSSAREKPHRAPVRKRD